MLDLGVYGSLVFLIYIAQGKPLTTKGLNDNDVDSVIGIGSTHAILSVNRIVALRSIICKIGSISKTAQP